MTDKYIVDIDKLKQEHVSVLRAIQKEGLEHMKYYNSTMGAFSSPENRVKCHDTIYYEEVLPIIKNVLDEYERRQKKSEG